MGIREIQKKMKLKEALAKKAAELKAKEIETKVKIQTFTAEKIREIAQKHGFLLAINDEILNEIEQLKDKYDIPETRIIRKIVKKEDILDNKSRINFERFGWYIFQEVLIKKEETGGIFTIPELYLFLKPLNLPFEFSLKDIEKSIQYLLKNRVIAGFEKLKSGIGVIYFFDERFTSDYQVVLNLGKKNGKLVIEDLLNLGWTLQRAEKILDSLVKSGIARYDESYLKGKRWYFPGLT
ncbi:MAG: hypothetical protein ACTSYF_07295 [Promethearchaeota archaeon]